MHHVNLIQQSEILKDYHSISAEIHKPVHTVSDVNKTEIKVNSWPYTVSSESDHLRSKPYKVQTILNTSKPVCTEG